MTYDLKQALDNPLLAISGRPKKWILEGCPGIYPISCTNITLQDTCYEEEPGTSHHETIFGSWEYVARGLKGGAGVSVDLSALRPSGTENEWNMRASGPVSFLGMYSHINAAIRQGNSYRNGAITTYLDITHPDIIEYLNYPTEELPWAKKAVYITAEIFEPEYDEVRALLLQRTKEGSIFWAKKSYDKKGNRLYSNVCMETLIPSRGSCNLSGINLGMIEPGDFESLTQAFVEGMEFLCELHAQSELGGSIYLSRDDDRQVLIHVIGFANMLVNWGLTYEEVVESFGRYRGGNLRDENLSDQLVDGLYFAYGQAAEVAKAYKMDRAFGIAPTESVSYRHKDLNGFTCTPEISAPIADKDTKITRRFTSYGHEDYQYPYDVAVAHHNVGFETHFQLNVDWQVMMNSTGLAHSISFNQWVPGCDFSEEYFMRWFTSPLVTSYYTLLVDQSAQDKTTIGIEQTQEDFDFWDFDDDLIIKEEPELTSEVSCSFVPGRPEGCSSCSG